MSDSDGYGAPEEQPVEEVEESVSTTSFEEAESVEVVEAAAKETDITVKVSGSEVTVSAPIRVSGAVSMADFGRELRDANVRAHNVAQAAVVAARISGGARNIGLSEKVSEDRTAVVITAKFEESLGGEVSSKVKAEAQKTASENA